MDTKLFFAFEGKEQEEGSKKKKSKKKQGTSSSSKKSESSTNRQFQYSLTEISKMGALELKTKMFTFDRKLAMSGDLTKINDSSFNMDSLLRKLKCMRGIDEEYIPTFKFF